MATEGAVTFLVVIWLCWLGLAWAGLGWLGLAGGSPAATHFAFASPKESKQRRGDPTVCGFLGSEPKFAEPLARPEGAVPCTAAKLVSDTNNLPCGARSSRGLVQTRLWLKQARDLVSVWTSAPQRIQKG